MKVKLGGKENFVWVVDEFDDDTYFDDKLISPQVISDKIDELYVI